MLSVCCVALASSKGLMSTTFIHSPYQDREITIFLLCFGNYFKLAESSKAFVLYAPQMFLLFRGQLVFAQESKPKKLSGKHRDAWNVQAKKPKELQIINSFKAVWPQLLCINTTFLSKSLPVEHCLYDYSQRRISSCSVFIIMTES